jgi:hypothetical protein
MGRCRTVCPINNWILLIGLKGDDDANAQELGVGSWNGNPNNTDNNIKKQVGYMIRYLFFCILCISTIWTSASTAAEIVCGVRSVTIRGNSAETFSAASCPDINLTLVSVRDYLPAKDHDFGFLVFKGINDTTESEYQFNGFSADEHAIANVDIYSLILPSYVKVESRQTHILTQSNPSLPTITIPQGSGGVVIIEIMGYQPAGDDDFEYVINPDPIAGTGFFITRLENGNNNSKVYVRLTVLTWPQNIGVTVDKGIIHVANRQSKTTSLPEWSTFAFTTPLGYVPRGDANFWFVTRQESANRRIQTRLTTGGGKDSSSVLVHYWSLKFPLVPEIKIKVPFPESLLHKE